MTEEVEVGRHKENAGAKENEAGANIRRGGKGRMKMKRELMRPSRTTRDFSSHVKPGHMNGAFGTAVTK